MDEAKLERLNLLIEQSKAFSHAIAQTLVSDSSTTEPKDNQEGNGEEPPSKKQKTASASSQYPQPDCIKNVTMKPHQIIGMNWLINLFQNGLNGILADEMGLGKTLQTITLIAFLKEQGIAGPYLVIAPLNVVPNWHSEFERFAPSLKVLSYVGPKDKRAELRKNKFTTFDVIVTSYDLVMVDFDYFLNIKWTYLVVDEGHRLKNFKSQLFSKLKELQCSNRLLLTGTPLQNNLIELWSLLNFILPNVFHDFHTFKNYFNLEEFEKLKKDGDEDNSLIDLKMKKALVENLHTILKPFILRRLKKDVLKLPPKKEFIVYSNHTEMQKKLYTALLETSLTIGTNNFRKTIDRDNASKVVRQTLLDTFLPIYIHYNYPELEQDVKPFLRKLHSQLERKEKEKTKTLNAFEILMEKKKRRNKVDYKEDSVTYGQLAERDQDINELESLPIWEHYQSMVKHFKSKSVLNPLPMLRQVCDSPYLLCWPWEEDQDDPPDDDGDNHVLNNNLEKVRIEDEAYAQKLKAERFQDLLKNTAKLQTLDSLIPNILKQNPDERILIFSQFVKTLKVLKIYFENHPTLNLVSEEHGEDVQVFPQNTLTLHGGHNIEERNEIFNQFAIKNSEGKLIGPKIFLLSTKAANLGLNLTISSTVILYDCDYNPTVDAQAIARVHRMGQERESLIYRLVSKATVEEVVVRKGEGKTWLADVVVESGEFTGVEKENTENLIDKDNLMDTLYRLYKFVNRSDKSVDFQGNALSSEEISILTNRTDEITHVDLPRVRLFADPNLNNDSNDMIQF